MKHFFLFLSLSVLFSCSVQKRKHQKGFYVNRIHQKNIKKPVPDNHTEVAKSLTDNIQRPIAVISGNSAEEASGNHSLRTVIKKSSTLFLQTAEDSCDILLFKDGSEIRAKVDEVNQTEVKYHRCDNVT